MSNAFEQSASSGPAKMVNVESGLYGGPVPLAGKTVAQARDELAKSQPKWAIDKNSKAFSGKTELADDHVLQPGESISFIKKMGEKG